MSDLVICAQGSYTVRSKFRSASFCSYHRSSVKTWKLLNCSMCTCTNIYLKQANEGINRLCGLVVRVPGYRSRGPGIDSRRYQIFWEVVGLERGPFSLVSINDELLGRNSNGSGLENRQYGRGDPLRWPRDTLYQQKLALTSPTSGGRSVDIVRLRTKATAFVLFVFDEGIPRLLWN
jgi:hypothetical protein